LEVFDFNINQPNLKVWTPQIFLNLMAVTRQSGNAVTTRQRRGLHVNRTLARPDWIPPLARGNQKKLGTKTDKTQYEQRNHKPTD
jgi:hypothetical protein